MNTNLEAQPHLIHTMNFIVYVIGNYVCLFTIHISVLSRQLGLYCSFMALS